MWVPVVGVKLVWALALASNAALIIIIKNLKKKVAKITNRNSSGFIRTAFVWFFCARSPPREASTLYGSAWFGSVRGVGGGREGTNNGHLDESR